MTAAPYRKKQPRYRRAGARWRLLVHRMRPGGGNGASIDVCSHAQPRPQLADPDRADTFDDLAARYATEHVLPGTELDEVVCGSWLHFEQMAVGRWWGSVGGVVFHVHADRDGRPLEVTVHAAGAYDDEVPGCRYEIIDT